MCDLAGGAVNVTVTPDVAPLRDPGSTDFSDLTECVRDGEPWWADGTTLVLPFDPEPSEVEQVRIRRRLMTRDADHEAWVGECVAALERFESSADEAAAAPLPGAAYAAALQDAAAAIRLLAVNALTGIDEPNG